MANYLKKTAVVDAKRYLPRESCVPDGVVDAPAVLKEAFCLPLLGWIGAFKSGRVVLPGDWIVVGEQGGKYVCRDAIFRETHELAEQ